MFKLGSCSLNDLLCCFKNSSKLRRKQFNVPFLTWYMLASLLPVAYT